MNDEKEKLRLKRNLKFLKKTYDLDTAMYDILESWLECELTTNRNIMTAEDMEDIAHQLPPLSQVLVPCSFNRVTQPLLISYQLLCLHDFNPVEPEFMGQFSITPSELESRTLKEQFSFLMFFEAKVKDVDDVLVQHKKQREQINAI